MNASPGQKSASPDGPELSLLYDDFEREHLTPLWTEIDDLMPVQPAPPRAAARLALGDPVPAGPPGRRAGAGRPRRRTAGHRAREPGLPGTAYATPTLWAAIQYLRPHEDAPEHRHTQHAFRFVVEGEGVWTVVDGDPVPMSRGDFLPKGGWNCQAHHNAASGPWRGSTAWTSRSQHYTEHASSSSSAANAVTERVTPDVSRSERLWGHPGLRPRPRPLQRRTSSPLVAYRWNDTDAALRDQLELEDDGHRAPSSPGTRRCGTPTPPTAATCCPPSAPRCTGSRAGVDTRTRREVGSSVWQVFDGSGSGDRRRDQRWPKGDLFVVPSWVALVRAVGRHAVGRGASTCSGSATPRSSSAALRPGAHRG